MLNEWYGQFSVPRPDFNHSLTWLRGDGADYPLNNIWIVQEMLTKSLAPAMVAL
jgi:hypothetical protein